ncbi:MAG: prepilin-type N-terminal cleavage/methylation domain-containing protein, partial [Cyanobacteria bacterium SIG30]|nr:prepilin-type N-terminal cleavage/methylation domain-containing protein [Cyanobacteria bacterium SIG30]
MVLILITGGGNNRLKAFTLAEVLITLAIIGVVAALTIPSVVTNYQNQE